MRTCEHDEYEMKMNSAYKTCKFRKTITFCLIQLEMILKYCFFRFLQTGGPDIVTNPTFHQ